MSIVTNTNNPANNSYGQILKSTTVVGGSQVINILLAIIRTKFMAVLLGPSGVGLMGLYTSVTGVIGTLTNMGIGASGVRQIAEAAGTGDEQKIARTIITLRRASLALGILGMLVMIILCIPLSQLTFGNKQYAWPIAILSVTLLSGAIAGGQSALIQGMRKITDLAKLGIWGSFLGTVISVPMIYLWGKDGIVPFLITISATSILTSWWYARKIRVAQIRPGWKEILQESKGLLSLGLVFMATVLMATAVFYLIRVFVVRQLGMESVGLYQSAATLSSMYIGVILGAMGMDFYPRLTTVANDNASCNRLVNEQTEVGLLLATPGILATLTFAPLVIHLFYSAQFIPAFEILRWQILGVFLRVVSWPMGYLLLAKGKGRLFFWTEMSASGIHLILIWIGLSIFGLVGTGIAFFLLYVFYTAMEFFVINHISGFKWTPVNLRLNGIFILFIALVFLLPFFLPRNIAMALNTVVTIAVSAYCLKKLYHFVGPTRFSDLTVRIKSCFGLSENK